LAFEGGGFLACSKAFSLDSSRIPVGKRHASIDLTPQFQFFLVLCAPAFMAKESYAESGLYLFLLLIGQTEHVDDLYDQT
jgi:hypothetical protein